MMFKLKEIKLDRKNIAFLTGTRADFGKVKSLIQIIHKDENFEEHIFVTGMHLQELYGYTLNEILACNFGNITTFSNKTSENTMDLTLAKTIEGFSKFINENKIDLIIIHGDRVEALAGAIVGALNNILVAHIEGGEVSGTIDELIRHSVSKMSHIHFVSNEEARQRLLQMGESEHSIKIIGSPDLDLMFSKNLPSLDEAKTRYEIPFEEYSIVMFHPITTEYKFIKNYAYYLTNALLELNENFIIIYPNNDLGNRFILENYEKLRDKKNFKIFPSLRFEYFLTLLKNARSIIGNSSAGVREAPYYGIPTINIGTRQNNRVPKHHSIKNTGYQTEDIVNAFLQIREKEQEYTNGDFNNFGQGKSAELFHQYLNSSELWKTKKQKTFVDLNLF